MAADHVSENALFDLSIPDTLVSAILILPVTLAPLTGFHVSKRGDWPVPRKFELSRQVFPQTARLKHFLYFSSNCVAGINYLSALQAGTRFLKEGIEHSQFKGAGNQGILDCTLIQLSERISLSICFLFA